MFFIFFANFSVNENIIEISLSKVVKIFKKDVIHIILIINRFVREIKRQNVIFINFHENDKND